MFANELNKSKVVQSYIGPISKGNIHLLHSMVHFTWLHVLYSHFPTKLNFGKFFYLFTKTQETIDKYQIDNYYKLRKERVKKTLTRSKKKKNVILSNKIVAHLNGK